MLVALAATDEVVRLRLLRAIRDIPPNIPPRRERAGNSGGDEPH
jgi:hypothetical protein